MQRSSRAVTSQSANHEFVTCGPCGASARCEPYVREPVTAKSAEKNNARGSVQLHDLTPRQLRICRAAILWYAAKGSPPTLKYLQLTAYGRLRKIIERDIQKIIAAGILTVSAGVGVRSLRPAPEYRLPFDDEKPLAEGVKGKMVGELFKRLQREGHHHVQSSQ